MRIHSIENQIWHYESGFLTIESDGIEARIPVDRFALTASCVDRDIDRESAIDVSIATLEFRTYQPCLEVVDRSRLRYNWDGVCLDLKCSILEASMTAAWNDLTCFEFEVKVYSREGLGLTTSYTPSRFRLVPLQTREFVMPVDWFDPPILSVGITSRAMRSRYANREINRPQACQGCSNYYGQVYNGTPLICAIHPSGCEGERCADWTK